MLLLYFQLTYARRFYSLQHLLYLTKRNDTSSFSFKMLTMTMQLYLQMKVHVIKGKRVSWLKAVTRDQHLHRGRAKTLSSLSLLLPLSLPFIFFFLLVLMFLLSTQQHQKPSSCCPLHPAGEGDRLAGFRVLNYPLDVIKL